MNNIQLNHNVIKIPRERGDRILPCFLFVGLCLAASAQAAELTVVVDGIHADRGNVRAALFTQAAGFPSSPAQAQVQPAKPWQAVFVFKGLEPGEYAVSAFHDLNANDKLDRNFVGKPKEPYGFSNNARGMFGPPEFDEARFRLGESGNTITFTVK